MAVYTAAEWKRIRAALKADPARYGLPERRSDSVLLASFNIRKLGDVKKRSGETWNFLAHVLGHFDLIAVHRRSA